MNLHDIEQRTADWHAARLGRVTASRIADVMATTKSGYSASRANYMAELIVQILTGQPGESYSNAAMAWGTDTEPKARDAYSTLTGHLVDETGFHLHPAIEQAGASPDGLVGADGLVEIKCPQTATHIDYLLTRKPPSKYVLQMQWQMACTQRSWCDFVSYDPRLPEHLQIMVVRVERDPVVITRVEEEVAAFLGELNAKVQQLLKVNQHGISQ